MKKSKSIQVSLKILLIIEEYSSKEISDAIKMIESDFSDDNNPLILFLKKISSVSKKKNLNNKRSDKEPQYSKCIADLKESDEEKFLLLSKLDKLIREGKVLAKLSDLRKLATQISKDFPNVKSRKDAIPKFMSLLVSMDIADARKIVNMIIQDQERNISESEYQELAGYIITNENN